MELARLDLNLLLVFHHLLREKRVSAVATVLGMSQPAVSSACSADPPDMAPVRRSDTKGQVPKIAGAPGRMALT